jgi:beta-galactosidase
MAQSKDGPGSLLSRRDLLVSAAKGAVLATAVPYLGRAQALPAAQNSVARVRESFDFGWKFMKGDFPGAQVPGFSDSGWGDVDLPHDWSIEGPFDEKAPSSGPGAYLPTGIGWYRKTFSVPDTRGPKLVVLEFDGVYQNSEVWINGHSLGLRPYGYIPFAYDLTPYLDYARPNVVAVRVDNSRQTNCRWYSGSGIDRHTWLLSTNQVHVSCWGTFVTTPRVSQQSATVQVKTRVTNRQKANAQCTLTTAILDRDGNTVQAADAPQEIESGGEYEFVQQLVIDKPALWSPASPYLYTVRSTLHNTSTNQVFDTYDTPFGIRERPSSTPKRGFLLNGEHVKLNGACIHQEAGCVGSAVPERMWERRLALLKEMGCNAIRTSHNPYAAEFLDLCDRMGFLVMNEAFDEWKVAQGPDAQERLSPLLRRVVRARPVKNFIHRDRNHPSVVLWSAGNEVPDQDDPEGTDTLRKLLRVFHTEDPTRPVTVGLRSYCVRADRGPGGRNFSRSSMSSATTTWTAGASARNSTTASITTPFRSARYRHRKQRMGGVRGEYRGLVP